MTYMQVHTAKFLVTFKCFCTKRMHSTVAPNYLLLIGPCKAKKCLRTCAKCAGKSSCPCAKYHPGPLLSIHTFCSVYWFYKRTAKALISLRRCAGWSGPSLSEYARRHVSALHWASWVCNQHSDCVITEPLMWLPFIWYRIYSTNWDTLIPHPYLS